MQGPWEASSSSDGVTLSYKFDLPDGSERILPFHEILGAAVETCREVERIRKKTAPTRQPDQPAMISEGSEGQNGKILTHSPEDLGLSYRYCDFQGP